MGVYYVSGVPYSSDHLMHFGILGQKWGIRRYQNPDGTLTEVGKERYRRLEAKNVADDIRKNYRKSSYDSSKIDGALDKAAAAVKDKSDIFRDKEIKLGMVDNEYFENKKVVDQFQQKAKSLYAEHIKEFRRDGYDEHDIQNYVYEQAYDLFLNSDHPLRVKSDKAYKEMVAAQKDLIESCQRYSREYLGRYGNKNVLSFDPLERRLGMAKVDKAFSDLTERRALQKSWSDVSEDIQNRFMTGDTRWKVYRSPKIQK